MVCDSSGFWASPPKCPFGCSRGPELHGKHRSPASCSGVLLLSLVAPPVPLDSCAGCPAEQQVRSRLWAHHWPSFCFPFQVRQSPGSPATSLCDAAACTVLAMSHPPQTSAADPSALLGAQVSPIFFCFTILRGFANVVFFFNIFISYYLRYDKSSSTSEMWKLCYTTKYCKKQKKTTHPPNDPIATFVKQKAKINKIGLSLSVLSPKQHWLVPIGQLPSAAESDGGCDESGAQCWGLAKSRRRWKVLLLEDLNGKREEIG